MKKYLPYLNILGAAACWGCIGLFNRFLMRAGIALAAPTRTVLVLL